MIAVIADDLTGAAEVGGVALRYGLTAEVQTEIATDADAGLIVIETDTRSCTAEEAARRVASTAEHLRESATDQIFKKVDSVLRGPVIAELTALLRVWCKPRVLLIPANPGLGRVISGGHYFVDGQPLHLTDFANDPEYPATTSDVVAILGPAGSCSVRVLRPGEVLPKRGVLVGEVTSVAELDVWAWSLDGDTLPAGAAEFFSAFLRVRGFQLVESRSAKAESVKHATALFVCGSTSSYGHLLCRRCEARGIPVLRMPPGLFGLIPESPELIQEWADATVTALKTHRRALVAIDQPLCRVPGLPQALSNHLGELVERAIDRQPVDHLFVEGGTTAKSLVRRFGWKRLRVQRELAPGVVRMEVEGQPRPLLTIKPGSYAWPDGVWERELNPA